MIITLQWGLARMSNENGWALGSVTNRSIERVLSFIEGRLSLNLDDSTLELLFWTMHPRYKFLKSLSINAKVLDIGANSGGMHHWCEWGHPHRSDIALYGIGLHRGDLAYRYAGWEVVCERIFNIRTVNLFDDGTHSDTYELDDVRARPDRLGFDSAEIDICQIARKHLITSRLRDNLSWCQMSLWCSTECCNCVAARRAA